MGGSRVLATAFILGGGISSAYGQSSPTSQDILARVSEAQKAQAKLEAEIAELRSRLLSETQKLKSWSASNVEGRVFEWRMIVAEVEMGIFAHDLVARPETPGIEVRCQFAAGDDNKNLKSQFPPGTEFVCVGRIDSILPRADKTVITLRQSKSMGGPPKASSEPPAPQPRRSATPTSIEEFFGSRYKIDRQPTTTHVIGRRDQIFSIDAEVSGIVSEIDRFGKWLQTSEGRAVPEKAIKLTVEAPTQDKYGNATGHAKLFTLSIPTDEIRKINYERVARFTIDFVTIEYMDPRAADGAVAWCKGGWLGSSEQFASNFCGAARRSVLTRRRFPQPHHAAVHHFRHNVPTSRTWCLARNPMRLYLFLAPATGTDRRTLPHRI